MGTFLAVLFALFFWARIENWLEDRDNRVYMEEVFRRTGEL